MGRLAFCGEALECRSAEQHAPADADAWDLPARLEASERGRRDRQHSGGFGDAYEIRLAWVLPGARYVGTAGQAFSSQASGGPCLQRCASGNERWQGTLVEIVDLLDWRERESRSLQTKRRRSLRVDLRRVRSRRRVVRPLCFFAVVTARVRSAFAVHRARVRDRFTHSRQARSPATVDPSGRSAVGQPYFSASSSSCVCASARFALRRSRSRRLAGAW